VKLRIDPGKCQGHGRCYDLSPDLFGDDDEGYGQVLGGGVVPEARLEEARKAVANCPESAISLVEDEGATRRV
jgi:ferredoxin